MKMLVLAFAVFASNAAFAKGAEEFKTLQDLKQAGSYRLTCSDQKGYPQVHVYAEVADSKVTNFKVYVIAPALSAYTIDLADKVTTAKFTGSNLQIAGGANDYFVTQVELNVTAAKNGYIGKFFFDDGDGTTIDRDVKCGAVNYVLAPSN